MKRKVKSGSTKRRSLLNNDMHAGQQSNQKEREKGTGNWCLRNSIYSVKEEIKGARGIDCSPVICKSGPPRPVVAHREIMVHNAWYCAKAGLFQRQVVRITNFVVCVQSRNDFLRHDMFGTGVRRRFSPHHRTLFSPRVKRNRRAISNSQVLVRTIARASISFANKLGKVSRSYSTSQASIT